MITVLCCIVVNILAARERKIRVVASLFPLYDFARNIGGERADVALLLPPGVEPHDYEPKAGDILKINSADIFIYTGKFMEPWVTEVLKGIENPGLEVIDASRGIPLMAISVQENNGRTRETVDPHIWLDFGNDLTIVDTILTGFIKKDPSQRQYYEQNALAYKAKLDSLDKEYARELGRCQKNVFVEGGHYTFGYLAKRYHLRYISAVGISPNAEPAPSDLVRLSEIVKKYGLKYVYFEELESPKIAQTIARETGAQLLELNGAHNLTRNEMKGGATFISLMEENLKNLKIGLQCR